MLWAVADASMSVTLGVWSIDSMSTRLLKYLGPAF